MDVLLGLTIIWHAGFARWNRLSFVGALLLLALFLPTGWWISKHSAMHVPPEGSSLIYYDEGVVATVSVVEDETGRELNVDQVFVAGTNLVMQTDQKSLAHWPMALVPQPRRALTVGFGSGGASYSYLLHDSLEEVHCVEICPGVVEARHLMEDANHGFYDRGDPRYRIIYDDARAYLRYTDTTYDIIATDCTDLKYKSSAYLYDLESFQFCRDKLRPGGVVVVWMPLGGVSKAMFQLTLRTFHRAMPQMGVFYPINAQQVHYILLVGWREQLSIDFGRIVQVLEEPDVRADMARINYDDPYKLLASFVTAGTPLEDYLAGDDRINTHDHPILEFEAPKHGYGTRTHWWNLRSLLTSRTSVTPWIRKGTMDPRQLSRYRDYERSKQLALRGQALERRRDIVPACQHFLDALKLTPDDKALHASIQFPDLERYGRLGDPLAWALLGRTRQMQGRLTDALRFFEQFERTLEDAKGPEMTSVFADRGIDDANVYRRTVESWRTECREALKAPADEEGQ